MHVPFGEVAAHAEKLKRGLQVLGPEFLARLCFWCKGETRRVGEGHCHVCGEGRFYGSALGLLTGSDRSVPASESVVNQVLVAAERGSLLDGLGCEGLGRHHSSST